MVVPSSSAVSFYFHLPLWEVSHRIQVFVNSGQALGRETNTWMCDAVPPRSISTTIGCLRALFNASRKVMYHRLLDVTHLLTSITEKRFYNAAPLSQNKNVPTLPNGFGPPDGSAWCDKCKCMKQFPAAKLPCEPLANGDALCVSCKPPKSFLPGWGEGAKKRGLKHESEIAITLLRFHYHR